MKSYYFLPVPFILAATLHAVFTDVPNVAGYKLYIWPPTPGVTPIAITVGIPPTTTPGVHVVDVNTNLPANSPFDAAVTAFDAAGSESAFSNIITGIIPTSTSTPTSTPTFTPTNTPTKTPVAAPTLIQCSKLDVDGNGVISPMDAYAVLAFVVGKTQCK